MLCPVDMAPILDLEGVPVATAGGRDKLVFSKLPREFDWF